MLLKLSLIGNYKQLFSDEFRTEITFKVETKCVQFFLSKNGFKMLVNPFVSIKNIYVRVLKVYNKYILF